MSFSLLNELAQLPPEVLAELLSRLALPWHLQFASKSMYALVHDSNVRLCVPVKLGELWGGGVKLEHVTWLHNHLVRFEPYVSITSVKLRMDAIEASLIDQQHTAYWPERHTPYLNKVLNLLFDRYRKDIRNVDISFCYSSFKFFKQLFDERMIALTDLALSMHHIYDQDTEEAWEVIAKLKFLTKLTWFGSVVKRAMGVYPRSLLEYVPQVKCLHVVDDFNGRPDELGRIDAKFWTFVCNRFADKVETCVQEGALTNLTDLSITSTGHGLDYEALTRTTTALAALTSLTCLELGHHRTHHDHRLSDAAASLRTVRPDMRVYVRY
jgi:hypothetical protein